MLFGKREVPLGRIWLWKRHKICVIESGLRSRLLSQTSPESFSMQTEPVKASAGTLRECLAPVSGPQPGAGGTASAERRRRKQRDNVKRKITLRRQRKATFKGKPEVAEMQFRPRTWKKGYRYVIKRTPIIDRNDQQLYLDDGLGKKYVYSVTSVTNLPPSRLFWDVPYVVPESAMWGPDEAIARLERALYAAFDSEVLEDGMDHPADDILENALSPGDDQPLTWLRDVSLDAERPSFAASVLRCLGRRADPGTTVWRADLVRKALIMKNVQIRDAAVQAAEHWADPNLIDILEGHDESERWLAQYIGMVLNDLKTS